MHRRRILQAGLGLIAWRASAAQQQPDFAPVVPGYVLRFPQDEGSHPQFRTEWWYVTGWLDTSPLPHGFQVTFFRTRPHPDTGNPSRFAPRHVLIAHAALSDPAHGRLRHEQRSARSGFGLADAATGATDVWIDDWHLRWTGSHYAARIDAKDFALDLRMQPTQPPLLQGQNGFSRKGPNPASASYYYSLPHLRVAGRIRNGDATRDVGGIAWLDHEWSSEAMDAEALGWDWAGINFDDGSALMGFVMRRRDGGIHWAEAMRRDATGNTRTFLHDEVRFVPQRLWTSPRTGAAYPVANALRAGDTTIDLRPLMDDQESDSRLTTGAIYWEGAVSAMQGGSRIGRGYLELTGYAKPLRF